MWTTLTRDFEDLLDPDRLVHLVVRLVFAALLGGFLGFQRERAHKPAGLRTHMLVTLGAALLIIVPDQEGMPLSDMSRVIQGVIVGIGFLGGGAILKLEQDKEITGLTSAAGIWLSAAIGIAVGMGRLGTATIGAILAFIILELVTRLERHIAGRPDRADR